MTNFDKIKAMSVEDLARFNVKLTHICDVDYDWDENSIERWEIVWTTSDEDMFDTFEEAVEHEEEWLMMEAE